MSRVFSKSVPVSFQSDEPEEIQEAKTEEVAEPTPIKKTLRDSYNALKLGDVIKKDVPEEVKTEETKEEVEEDSDDVSKSIYYIVKGIRMMMKRMKDV
jgi:hypothetical protein